VKTGRIYNPWIKIYCRLIRGGALKKAIGHQPSAINHRPITVNRLTNSQLKQVHHRGTEITESENWKNLQPLDKDLLPTNSRWRSQKAIGHQPSANNRQQTHQFTTEKRLTNSQLKFLPLPAIFIQIAGEDVLKAVGANNALGSGCFYCF